MNTNPAIATQTLKRTARLLADRTSLDYQAALFQVTSAVTDLRIDRVRYNQNLRSWEISAADSAALIDQLAEFAN